jgi:hypothetical protein
MALWIAVACAVLAAVVVYGVQPSFARPGSRPGVAVERARLEGHVRQLSEKLGPRDHAHVANLERVADYVRAELGAAGAATSDQAFAVGGRTYRNVRAFVGPPCPPDGERVVVGAHYDTCGALPGADDNASGVAGLIELARALHAAPPALPVELVAFTLEEPPHFRTPDMGSAVHARSLRRDGARVRAMISLEMIGCFRDEPGSQSFPAPLLGLIYPRRGDFVAVVACLGQAALARRVKRSMAEATPLPVWSINAPRFVPGIDLSDHLNYWDAGFDAVMVTDTAFCRNVHYHEAGDTADRLDFGRMADVVRGVHAAVVDLAR